METKRSGRLACGANSDDYEWTQEVMKACFRRISPQQHGMKDGLSLHYYTVPETWDHKGSATEFAEKDWYKTMKKTMYMEELIRRHSAIMDQYDPDKKVGMIVDEWGTWYDVEPGTNPGFLYQQNTMRDALVAGINLNLFNKHSDRVKMANIAQMVNVLQSMILTEGEKMVKTPTYHVFDLYQVHQENDLLASSLENGAGWSGRRIHGSESDGICFGRCRRCTSYHDDECGSGESISGKGGTSWKRSRRDQSRDRNRPYAG